MFSSPLDFRGPAGFFFSGARGIQEVFAGLELIPIEDEGFGGWFSVQLVFPLLDSKFTFYSLDLSHGNHPAPLLCWDVVIPCLSRA